MYGVAWRRATKRSPWCTRTQRSHRDLSRDSDRETRYDLEAFEVVLPSYQLPCADARGTAKIYTIFWFGLNPAR